MKKLLTAVLLFTVSLIAKAGDDEVRLVGGSYDFMRDNANMLCEIDYSKTTVDGQTLQQYLKSRGDDFVRDWPEDCKKAREYFTFRFNKKSDGVQICESKDSNPKYIMVLHVKTLDMGNGASKMFNPWASMKAGGVIANIDIDVAEYPSGKAVAKIAVPEIKGNGHVSETVRLGLCYNELATVLTKVGKKSKDVLPINDSDIDVGLRAAKAAPKAPAAKKEEAAPAASTSGKATTGKATSGKSSGGKNGSKKTTGKTNNSKSNTAKVNTETEKPAAQETRQEPVAERHTPAKGDTPGSAVKSAKFNGSVGKDGFGGTLSSVSKANEISLYLDFSSCTFDRRSEEAFVNSMMTTWDMDMRNEYFDLSWEYYKSMVASDFLNNLNASLEDEKVRTKVVRKQGAPYTLKIVFKEIDDDGETKADYLLVNTKSGNVEAAFLKIYDEDGGSNYMQKVERGLHKAAKSFSEEFAKKMRSGK